MPDRPASPLEAAIVDGYLVQLGREGGDLHWSWSVLEDLVMNASEYAWPLLLELVARAPDAHLGTLAAGPLEDFLAAHGRTVIGRVEAQAAADSRFRLALRGVWQNYITDDVWARVVAASRPDEATVGELALTDEHQAEARRRSGYLEIEVEGLPLGLTEDSDTEQLAASRLRAALQDELPREQFTTPVGIDLRLLLPPESPPLDLGRIAHTVVAELANPAGSALLASPKLVWDLRVFRLGESIAKHYVSVYAMTDEQVEELSSVNDSWD